MNVIRLHLPGGDSAGAVDRSYDIACGRAIGARTLAVATGHSDPDVLRAHRPDAFLPDLSDATRFWDALGG